MLSGETFKGKGSNSIDMHHIKPGKRNIKLVEGCISMMVNLELLALEIGMDPVANIYTDPQPVTHLRSCCIARTPGWEKE